MILALLVGCGGPSVCPAGSDLQEEVDGEAVLQTCVDAQGVREGPRRRTVAGQLLWEEHYVAGALHGRRDLYAGPLRLAEVDWREGVRHGTAIGRYPSGMEMYRGRFVNGLADGDWTFYGPDDPLPVAEMVFEAGEPRSVGGEVLVKRTVPVVDGRVALEASFVPKGEVVSDCGPDRVEVLSWPGRDLVVAGRACGVRCSGWALTTPFASAGPTVFPACDAKPGGPTGP